MPSRPLQPVSLAPTLLAPLLLALVCACSAPRPVHFSSSPPGASVHVDGEDSGLVTPCLIDLEETSTRRVEFVLPGYQTEVRTLRHEDRSELVFWREAAKVGAWNFPLWLPAEDFFLPRKDLSGETPARLYVRLRREADR